MVLYWRPEVCMLGVRDGDLGFALYYCVGVVVACVVEAMLTYVAGFYELEGVRQLGHLSRGGRGMVGCVA